MKKIIVIFILAALTAGLYAAPKVSAVCVKMEEPQLISSAYDSTFSVLDNSICMYIYRDYIVATANQPAKFICRVRINKKWYRLPNRDFGIYYYGRRLNKRDMNYIKQFEEKK